MRYPLLLAFLISLAHSAFIQAANLTKPPVVKVFILAGQSNMEGHGYVAADPQRNEGKGSLEAFAKQADKAISTELLLPSGEWKERDDVLIHYLDRKGHLRAGFGVKEDRIGPELGFGIVVGNYFKEPVLLIKLAWGGKSLAADFRPPSAGGTTGPYYQELIQRTRTIMKSFEQEFPELAGYELELTGFGWHQGWNDRVNQQFNDEYEQNLVHLINDVRKDLNSPNLPFVIAETGMTGPNEVHPRALSLMAAQKAAAERPEFRGNVAFVSTRSFYREPENSPTRQGYHWNSNGETYFLIGQAMGEAMVELLSKNE